MVYSKKHEACIDMRYLCKLRFPRKFTLLVAHFTPAQVDYIFRAWRN